MELPTKQECLKMFEEYLVPKCVYRHCRKVSRAGVALAEALKRNGVDVDIPLVEIGCLLHDMMKVYSLPNLNPKPEAGYYGATDEERLLWEKLRSQFEGLHETLILSKVLEPRYPEFAHFVSRIGSTGNPTYFEGPIELKIIHYADWRIENDVIVSFSERLEYLTKTYKHKWQKQGWAWWEHILNRERDLERELFDHLDIAPDNLARVVIRYIDIQRSKPEEFEQAVRYAIQVLKNGGIIVYPAKNGYMIGVNPFDEWALRKVYEMKRRPRDQFLACVVSDIAMVEEYTSLIERERLVAQTVMPGPILLVAHKSPYFPDLFSEEGFTFTIARTDVARALLDQIQHPLVATSCNISSYPVHRCVDEIGPHILNYVDVIFDAGELPYQPDYTVVKFANEEFIIRREGLVDAHDIRNILDTSGTERGLAESTLLVQDRVSVLERLLAITTLDPQVTELWLRNRIEPHPSDFVVVVVTHPGYRDQVYAEGCELFLQARGKSSVPSDTSTKELRFKLESGLVVSIRYTTDEDKSCLDITDCRMLWSRNLNQTDSDV